MPAPKKRNARHTLRLFDRNGQHHHASYSDALWAEMLAKFNCTGRKLVPHLQAAFEDAFDPDSPPPASASLLAMTELMDKTREPGGVVTRGLLPTEFASRETTLAVECLQRVGNLLDELAVHKSKRPALENQLMHAMLELTRFEKALKDARE
jgi:hypothetical protein